MNRSIIFRGKAIDENFGWVKGYVQFNTDRSRARILYLVNEDDCFFYTASIDVIPETVGQYTNVMVGLYQQAFEGDILEIDGRLFVVVYNYQYSKFDLKSISGVPCPEWSIGIIARVVGNIYDNPELL